jgi:hypothetical protein
MTEQPTYIVMPVLGARDYTIAAIADVLAQSVPVRLLVINQGVDDGFREELEGIAEAELRVLVWSHQPRLPSLSATWNRALDCVWACGGEEALVVNNDTRLHRSTVEYLTAVLREESALFVTAVGVLPEQFNPMADYAREIHDYGKTDVGPRGGPDFSCFLIAKACHDRFRFDEAFTPSYLEDCDYHRRVMLAGEGQRIFSVNLPYLHYASGTLKSMDTLAKLALEREIEQGSRRHYLASWGGTVNAERFLVKGDPSSAREHVTNPELQRRVQAGEPVLPEATHVEEEA